MGWLFYARLNLGTVACAADLFGLQGERIFRRRHTGSLLEITREIMDRGIPQPVRYLGDVAFPLPEHPFGRSIFSRR